MTIPINNFEKFYTINDSGINNKTIFSIRRNRYLKPTPNQNGYLTVSLHVKGVEKRVSLHVLLAKHFLENPNNYTIVHHKNHNNQDNTLGNLEWVSEEIHKALHAKKPQSKPRPESKFKKIIYGLNKVTGEKIKFNSVTDAASYVNGDIGNICAAAHKRMPSAYGYFWSYNDKFESLS